MLELKNITQKYGEVVIFNDFNITIKEGFTSLMGKSGSGKSTLMRYFTRLQKPTSGEIYINGKLITDDDIIPMVFQEKSLLDHMTVVDNVALPLYIKGVNKNEAKDRAIQMLKVVGLEDQANKFGSTRVLSGGQMMRISIARSLVANPTILFLDEAFAALDSTTRKSMQDFVKDLQRNTPNSIFLMISHDERESAYLSDEIYVLGVNPAHIKQHLTIGNYSRDSRELFEVVNHLESII